MTSETGTLVQVVEDDFEHGHARYAYGLQRANRSFVALEGLDPSEAKGLVGQTVRATGKAVGKDKVAAADLVPADAGTTATSTGTTAAAGAAASYRKVAVILVNFSDNPVQPVTADQVRGTMFSNTQNVDAYYQDASDGGLGISGDVFGWYTVSRSSTSSCDFSAWGNSARDAAVRAGVNLADFQHVMYYWPQQSSCSWAGLGQLPGDTTWINGYNSLRVLGHELGHNLGEHHASAQQCSLNGAYVPFNGGGATCTNTEYGDPFTIMGGSSYYLHSNAARSHLGWLAPVTAAAGTGGTWTLAPADSTAGGTRMVRFPRGDGSYLSLEFRQPTGTFDTFSTTAPVVNGVTIRVDWGTGTKQTMLVDVVPSSNTYSDAPLPAGQSVTDPVSGATITTNSVSATGASVTVSYGGGGTGGSGGTTTPPADTTAPSSVSGLTATATSTPSASLSWNAATDDVGVTGYRVSRNGTVLGTVASRAYADSAVVAGQTYTYSVAAVDAAGNVGASTSVSVTVPQAQTGDTSAPTTVTNLRATKNKKGVVSVSWNASSDNVAVTGYTISRTGLSKTQTSTSLTDKPGRGTITYTVVARDAAGNTSAPVSVSITV